MTIVSNASPLINLARIGKLDLLTEVKPHLDALRWEASFRVSNALYRRVLRDEGEKL